MSAGCEAAYEGDGAAAVLRPLPLRAGPGEEGP
jgi:hypothetical protein